METSAIRTPPAVKPAACRSAVTNGKRLSVKRPGDTAWARRFADILAEIISDIGGHGGGLSEGQRQLARRCATIAAQCERMEGEAAARAQIDLEVYGTLADRLGRAFQRLGLKRQPRDVTLTLEQYLREHYGHSDDSAPQDAANISEGA
jgi:hypothetical protein